jgi:hypothetical protein
MKKSAEYINLICAFEYCADVMGLPQAKAKLIQHIKSSSTTALTTSEVDTILLAMGKCGDAELTTLILNESYSKDGINKAFQEAIFSNNLVVVKLLIEKLPTLANDCGLTLSP